MTFFCARRPLQRHAALLSGCLALAIGGNLWAQSTAGAALDEAGLRKARAQALQMLAQGQRLKVFIEEFVANNGTLEGVGMQEELPRIADVVRVSRDGQIILQRAGLALVLVLTPTLDGGEVKWQCRASDVNQPFVPGECLMPLGTLQNP